MQRTSLTTRLLVVAGMVLGGIAPSGLQAQNQSAGIIGTLTDSGGRVVPNARITVTSPALQVPKLIATTDEQGSY
jgi:hypothetical protein